MERIDLGNVRHAERQRWRNGGEWDQAAPKVAVGELADGRWYVRRYDGYARWPAPGTCAYTGPAAERLAQDTARRWKRTLGGEWVQAAGG